MKCPTLLSRLSVVLAAATVGAGLVGCGAVSGADAVSMPGAFGTATSVGADEVGTRVAAVFTPAVAAKLSRADVQRQVISELVEERVVSSLAARRSLPSVQPAVDGALHQVDGQPGGRVAIQQQVVLGSAQQQPIPAYAGLDVYLISGETRLALAGTLAGKSVPEEVLQAGYQQAGDTFHSAHLAHIVVADGPAAQQLAAQLRAAPTTFSSVAQQVSIDTASKAQGGDQGTVPLSSLPPARAAAVRGATAGAILGPTPVQGGFEILQVVTVTDQTFEQARPALQRQLSGPDSAYVQSLVTAAEAQEAQRMRIAVNPRFGRIDVTRGLAVAPPADPLSTLGRAAASPSAAGDAQLGPPGGSPGGPPGGP